MIKNIRKTTARDSDNATRVKRTAELCGVSTRQVYRVIKGDQVNSSILEIYMFLENGEKNLLIKAIEKAVPFNNN